MLRLLHILLFLTGFNTYLLAQSSNQKSFIVLKTDHHSYKLSNNDSLKFTNLKANKFVIKSKKKNQTIKLVIALKDGDAQLYNIDKRMLPKSCTKKLKQLSAGDKILFLVSEEKKKESNYSLTVHIN